MLEVREARIPDEVPLVRALFEEYAAWLNIDMCFQGFAAELAELPGAYAPPAGRILLAWLDGQCAGCVALRPLVAACCSTGISKLTIESPESAEMKRLYVPSRFRGRGVGRVLAERVLVEAASAGYRQVRLDTLPSMTDAIKLYRSLGFAPVESYYENPVAGALFFVHELDKGFSSSGSSGL